MQASPNVKLNLGLSVLRKRPDGYHDLETLFVPYFGFHDRLEIELSSSLQIDIRYPEGLYWEPMEDLTVKAWKVLRQDFDIPPVHISLEKGSPVGAGLGGGSADGAFALKMTAALCSLDLSDEQLARYAAMLGSDCAFFIYNRPMIGEGRGERLKDCILDLSGYEIEVAVPEGVKVSTAEAYRGVVPRENRPCGLPSLEEALALPVERWKDTLVNDFETSVFTAHPQIRELKEDLYRRGAVYASMSGSGSAVFGIFPKKG